MAVSRIIFIGSDVLFETVNVFMDKFYEKVVGSLFEVCVYHNSSVCLI